MKKLILNSLVAFNQNKFYLLALIIIAGFCDSLSAQHVDFYFTTKNGWNNQEHVRTLGDVNGDGKADIVGFGGAGVYVSFSNGTNFSVPKLLVKNFAIGAGAWLVKEHPRMLADVNGDGKADVVGFGGGKVFVALSQGTTFSDPVIWLDHYFTPLNGWKVSEHVRTVADVNGDGKADIVGFGGAGVDVALSDGAKFSAPELLVKNFAIGAGAWDVSKHTRLMADINQDQKTDIVGFGREVYTALSTGNGFAPIKKNDLSYYTNPGWWNLRKHRRMCADVNGDGRADIIGFTEFKVYVSLATSDGFEYQNMCFQEFVYTEGWAPEKYPVLMGDINGDGKADIIGFKDDKIYTSCSNGECFDPVRAVSFF